jgi:hypothetical protein
MTDAANVVTFRDDDGKITEARVLETEINLNWVWLRIDDGTPEGRWIRSDVVEAFTMVNHLPPASPNAHKGEA